MTTPMDILADYIFCMGGTIAYAAKWHLAKAQCFAAPAELEQTSQKLRLKKREIKAVRSTKPTIA